MCEQLLCEAGEELHDFVLQHLGKFLFERQRYDEAHAALTRALVLHETRADPALLASTRQALAAVQRARGT